MANILITENNAEQAPLRDAKVSFGHTAKLAYTGAEARSPFPTEPFDILITDIHVTKAPERSTPTGETPLIAKTRHVSCGTENSESISRLKITVVTEGAQLPAGHDPLAPASRFGADMCLREPVDLDLLPTSIDGLSSDDTKT